ncbi:MAG: hypothetical protein MJ212_04665 [Alphaproteobacteria bacterium]|nr:hypothetical protein [Alphaproteobacteria bacterium]
MILLNIANPLNYLLIWWIYTCTYSIPLTVAGVWAAVELFKSKSRTSQFLYAAIFGLVMALGYFLRPTVLISGVAVALCCVFYRNKATLSVYWKQLVCIILSAVLSFAICFFFFFLQVSAISGDDTKNFPITHWIMMGLHNDGQVTYQDMNFTRKLGTTDKMKEEHLSEITKSLRKLGAGDVTELAVNKMQKTWSDGTADYHFRLIQAKNYGLLYRWLVGDKRDIVNSYCHCYRFAILLLAIVCLARQCFNKKVNSLCLFTLCLDGAVLFYMIWEAKSIYSVPFLPFLSVLSFSGADTLNRKISKQGSKLFSFVGITVILLTVVVGTSYYQEMTKNTFLKTDYSINCANGRIDDYTACYDKISKENKKIEQTFHTDKAFNRISIAVAQLDGNKECLYKISLLKNKNSVFDTVIDKDTQKNGFVELKVNCPASQKGNGNYKIVIESATAGTPDSLAWRYTKAKVIDQYNGVLSIGNKETNEDLYISVKNISKGIYIRPAFYILLFVALCLLEVGVIFAGNRIYSKKQL